MDLKKEIQKLDDEALATVYAQVSPALGAAENPQSKTHDFWRQFFDILSEEYARRQEGQLDDGFTNNVEIRRAVRDKNLKMYKIAERLGVSATHFSRMLQTELSKDRKEQVMDIIAEM